MMVKMLAHIFFFIFGLKFAKIQLKNYNILLLDGRGIEPATNVSSSTYVIIEICSPTVSFPILYPLFNFLTYSKPGLIVKLNINGDNTILA